MHKKRIRRGTPLGATPAFMPSIVEKQLESRRSEPLEHQIDRSDHSRHIDLRFEKRHGSNKCSKRSRDPHNRIRLEKLCPKVVLDRQKAGRMPSKRRFWHFCPIIENQALNVNISQSSTPLPFWGWGWMLQKIVRPQTCFPPYSPTSMYDPPGICSAHTGGGLVSMSLLLRSRTRPRDVDDRA